MTNPTTDIWDPTIHDDRDVTEVSNEILRASLAVAEKRVKELQAADVDLSRQYTDDLDHMVRLDLDEEAESIDDELRDAEHWRHLIRNELDNRTTDKEN